MIVKCTSNTLAKVPKKYLVFAPDQIDEEHLASSIGKYYAVYACRLDDQSDASWYFIITDSGHMWWMPSTAYEITDDKRPDGWLEKVVHGEDLIASYPSLHNWSVEEEIIDGEKDAKSIFFAEAEADPTFPSLKEIDMLNIKFEQRRLIKKYEKDLAIAKLNGWERPEKPANIDH